MSNNQLNTCESGVGCWQSCFINQILLRVRYNKVWRDVKVSIKALKNGWCEFQLSKTLLIQKGSGEIRRNANWPTIPSSHPSSEQTIIHLDEDRPHKISILMAPNYPEQRPAKPKAPVSFRNLKQDKSRRILGLQHARLWLWLPLFLSLMLQ